MIKITETQLFDWMNCPALFEMKYVKQLPITAKKQTVSTLLGKVSSYFYIQLLNGKVCSLAELKRKWDSIAETHSLSQKEVLEGMHEIAKFGNWMGHEQPIVLDINTPYTIVIGNVEIQGNLLPVFKKEDGVELVHTDFSKRIPDQRLVDLKLKYTLDAFVYQELYGKPVNGIRVHSVKNDKDLRTTRMQPDFDRLISTVTGIGKAIEAGAYYTRENLLCGSCPALQYCGFWHTRDTHEG